MRAVRALPTRSRQRSCGPWAARRGAIVVLAAVMLVVVLAMVAFTVDIGYIVVVDTDLQRTADACALAAAAVLPERQQSLAVAQASAGENAGLTGPALEVSDVEYGVWDRDTATFTASESSDINAVRVTVRRTSERGNPLTLFFAQLLGRSQADVVTTATAMYDHSLCGPLVGIEWVSVPGEATSDSYRSGSGPYQSQTPRDNGSLCSDGPIVLEGNPVVNGNANPGRGHRTTLEGDAVVTGNTSPRLRPLNMPPVDATAMAADNDNSQLPRIPKGNSLVSPVDGNGNFLLDGGAVYTMPPGEYYFRDFTLTGNSQLYFQGPTTLYITGNLDTAGGDLFNATQVPGNLQMLMTGGTARVAARVDFHGVLYAPNSAVTLDGGAHWYGGAVGRTLTATGSGDFHYDEDLDGDLDLPKRIALVQ